MYVPTYIHVVYVNIAAFAGTNIFVYWSCVSRLKGGKDA